MRNSAADNRHSQNEGWRGRPSSQVKTSRLITLCAFISGAVAVSSYTLGQSASKKGAGPSAATPQLRPTPAAGTVPAKGDVPEAADVLRIIDRFRGYGIDGVECFYATHTREQTELLADRCEELSILSTGSSDFHGPAHRQFSQFRAFSTFGREPRLGPIAG